MVRPRALLVLAIAAGCAQDGLDAAATPPALDAPFFRCEVEPVLAARCAFLACHGSARRPFRLFARNRLRLDAPIDQRALPLSAAEEAANYDQARGFAGDATRPSLLLLKPLAEAAGGWYHRGDLYGQGDVFASTDDPGYDAIARWTGGATAPADCTPADEVTP